MHWRSRPPMGPDSQSYDKEPQRLLAQLLSGILGACGCVSLPATFVDAGSQGPVWDGAGGRYAVSGRYFGEQPLGLTLTRENRLAEILELTQTGDFTFVVSLDPGEAYAVAALPSGGDTCQLTNASGNMTAAGASDIEVRCGRVLSFDSGAAAASVVGQPNFTSNGGSAVPDAKSLYHPWTVWHSHFVDYNQLYVVDSGRNRIVALPFTVTQGGPINALFAIGQPNLVSANPGSSAATLNAPAGLASDTAVLAAGDVMNNRVLLFRPFPRGLQNASAALGQSLIDGNAPSCGPSGMNHPTGVALRGGRLAVADTLNNRVLVWKTLPTSLGQPADLALGQPRLDTCRSAMTSANSMRTPAGVWTDGERLAVADTGNNRVLLWMTFPTVTGQAADIVLGQPDMTQSAAATSSVGLSAPSALESNNLQLIVADSGNQRVLLWNSFPQQSSLAADTVLGQPDFATAGAQTTATGLGRPVALTTSDSLLIVSDYDNNRLVVYASKI